MRHFLLKTEPTTYSIDHLERDGETSWGGVRNYTARNHLRDMREGDICIVYHSSCAVPAAVGLAVVSKVAYPDPLQFDRKSEYFDEDSKITDPRWSAVDIQFAEKFDTPVPLTVMREDEDLKDMQLLAKGNRLSVLPLTPNEYRTIRLLSHS